MKRTRAVLVAPKQFDFVQEEIPKLLMKPSVTDKGKDVIIAAKNKRIRELEAEVDRLSSILKSFYAKEYEKY